MSSSGAENRPFRSRSAAAPVRHALTFGVPDPEVELGGGVTLRGGQTEPPDGFRVVLRYALIVVVHDRVLVLKGKGVWV